MMNNNPERELSVAEKRIINAIDNSPSETLNSLFEDVDRFARGVVSHVYITRKYSKIFRDPSELKIVAGYFGKLIPEDSPFAPLLSKIANGNSIRELYIQATNTGNLYGKI